MPSVADQVVAARAKVAADGVTRAAGVAIPAAHRERELRLDLFRGLALWLIFVDHLPTNILTWLTIRNYGFSDATEIFIFISGYTAAFVYGRAMMESGFVIASARIMLTYALPARNERNLPIITAMSTFEPTRNR